MEWQTVLQKAFEIISNEETSKRELWRISFELKKEFGSKGLQEFSDNLKETFGITRSYNTLRQYAYVYEMVQEYEIPEDIPYTAIRAILSSRLPLDYIKLINDGASYQEVLRKINKDNPKKEKQYKCHKCGKVLVCSCSHTVSE